MKLKGHWWFGGPHFGNHCNILSLHSENLKITNLDSRESSRESNRYFMNTNIVLNRQITCWFVCKIKEENNENHCVTGKEIDPTIATD
jgi:hypothetical protein